MNYLKIYNQLIIKRRLNPWNRSDGYCEYHHIIPVSEGGYRCPREPEYNHEGINLIGLTAREHYIAHLLLFKLYHDRNMGLAYTLMRIGNKKQNKHFNFRFNSRLYEKLRIEALNLWGKSLCGKMCITDGVHNTYIDPIDEIPEGWHKGGKKIIGRKQSEEGSKRRFETMKQNGTNKQPYERGQKRYKIRQQNGTSLSTAGNKWYNNGIINISLRPDQIVPEGFIPGQKLKIRAKLSIEKQLKTRKERGLTMNLTQGYTWCNNGVKNKFLKPGEQIPEGYVYGKLQKSYSSNKNVYVLQMVLKINIFYQLI